METTVHAVKSPISDFLHLMSSEEEYEEMGREETMAKGGEERKKEKETEKVVKMLRRGEGRGGVHGKRGKEDRREKRWR